MQTAAYTRKGDYPGAEDSENPVRLMQEVKSVAGRTYTMGNLLATVRLSSKLHFTAGLSGQTGASYNLYYSGRDIRGYSDTQQGVATAHPWQFRLLDLRRLPDLERPVR